MARRNILVIAVPVMLVGLLAGCGPGTQSIALAGGSTRQIIALEDARVLKVLGPAPGRALGDAQKEQIKAFISEYLYEGTGPFTMMIPSVKNGQSASTHTIRQVYSALVTLGLDPDFIERQRYWGSSNTDFRLTYASYETSVPACDVDLSSVDTSRTLSNSTPANFGCGVTVNIARMIADPRDVIGPADETPPNAERRRNILNRYVEGEATTSDRGDGEEGSIQSISSR